MDFLKKLPIGQYVDGKSGWIRSIDPRLKVCWVMIFLITPVLAGALWRSGLVLGLLLLTFLSLLPPRIWWRSVLWLLIISLIVGLLAMFLPTSEESILFNVRSTWELPNAIPSGVSWEIINLGPIYIGEFEIGPLLIDRRSWELGIKTSTLLFTVVHSVNLMLLTTPPEDLVWALSWFLRPLAILRLPADRISFQLLLALRFLPLVQEELQNLLKSLATRAVDFRLLGIKGSLRVFLSLGERFLANILLRAEQGAEALLVRNRGLMIPSEKLRSDQIGHSGTLWLNIISGIALVFTVFIRHKYGEF